MVSVVILLIFLGCQNVLWGSEVLQQSSSAPRSNILQRSRNQQSSNMSPQSSRVHQLEELVKVDVPAVILVDLLLQLVHLSVGRVQSGFRCKLKVVFICLLLKYTQLPKSFKSVNLRLLGVAVKIKSQGGNYLLLLAQIVL